MSRFICSLGLGAVLLGLFTGCSSVKIAALEKMGYEKRDIVVGRVKKAQVAQEDAQEQFKDALEAFSALVDVKGGALEKKYNELSKVYDKSASRAQAVRDRIDSVEAASNALFKEWKKEIGAYSSASLKRKSQDQLTETKKRYEQLMSAMEKAEGRMDPVLAVLKDQVMFLKHNLNAKAIASLKAELGQIETDVSALVRDLDAAIKEADTFIKGME